MRLRNPGDPLPVKRHGQPCFWLVLIDPQTGETTTEGPYTHRCLRERQAALQGDPREVLLPVRVRP